MHRFFLTAFLLLLTSPLPAAALAPEQKLAQCLKHAEQTPDDGAAEAGAWVKKGGGERARLCRAFAQFHRGEFLSAAQEFQALAQLQVKQNPKQAASLYAQAGLAYARLNDHARAETQYAAALKLEPQDPEIWMDRAVERASAERYWEAIDDLNRALTIMPEMTEALRLRGQAWVKLGQDSKARADFERAELLDHPQP